MNLPEPLMYLVEVSPLDEVDGGGFVAVAPDLPGCFSDGQTPEEASHNAHDAIVCWMEAAEEMSRAIPKPRRAAA